MDNYVNVDTFDKEGFFFITYRSNAIGTCFLWKTEERCDLKYLAADPSWRERDVEKCLAGLAIEYLKNRHPEVKTLYVEAYDDDQATRLRDIGFVE